MPAEPLAKGTVVGRFLVTEPLEGNGELYAAYDPGLERRVALRLLPLHAVLEEARAVTLLTHPNVVSVHDVGMFEGRPYVAMELVDGTSLIEWQADAPADAICEAYAAAARGLEAAHAQGLVHRDFHPGNVFIGANARVRVGNYGPTPSPEYLAPEQLRGEEPDARSDQFSFCAALYEALAGHRPFEAEDPETLLDVMQRVRPTSPRLPRRLAPVLLRGLAPDPNDRNESMAPVIAALEPSRHRITALALAAGGAALGIGIWATLQQPGLDNVRGGYCATIDAQAAETWTAQRRAQLVQVLMTDAAVHAQPSVDAAADAIDRYVARWTSTVTSLCADEAAGVSKPRAAAQMACLQGRLVSVSVLIDTLLSGGPAVRANALTAIDRLPSLTACQRERKPIGLDNPELPQATVAELSDLFARSRAKAQLSFHQESLELAEQAVALARSSGDAALIAEALYHQAYALANLGRDDTAAELAHECTRLAVAAEHHWIAFYSLAFEATLIADRGAESTRSKELLDLAAAQIEAYGQDDSLDAWLLSTRAYVASREGRVQEALDYYEQAAEKRTAREHPMAAAHDYINVGGLAIASGDTPRGVQSLELAESMLLPLYGPKHQTMVEIRTNMISAKLWLDPGPETLELTRTTLADAIELFGERHEISVFLQGRYARALMPSDLDEARAQAARSVQMSAAAFGATHPNALAERAILVTILTQQGAVEQAQQELDEAFEVAESPEAHLLLLQAQLHRLAEDHEQALAAGRRAVEQGVADVGEESSDLVAHREIVALSLVSLGRIDDALNEHDTMARVLRAAVLRGEWLETQGGLAIARFAESLAKAVPDHPRLVDMVADARRQTDSIDIETSDEAELLRWLRAR